MNAPLDGHGRREGPKVGSADGQAGEWPINFLQGLHEDLEAGVVQVVQVEAAVAASDAVVKG